MCSNFVVLLTYNGTTFDRSEILKDLLSVDGFVGCGHLCEWYESTTIDPLNFEGYDVDRLEFANCIQKLPHLEMFIRIGSSDCETVAVGDSLAKYFQKCHIYSDNGTRNLRAIITTICIITIFLVDSII